MNQIEQHATLFALLSRQAITLAGEAGKEAILKGMTKYGNERGARMAKRALANGEELTTMTNQAYGEWKPDYAGQMDFGTVRTEPTLQTYIAKCAWCDAWKKHDLLEYGMPDIKKRDTKGISILDLIKMIDDENINKIF